ncbi:DAZ-associated protein 2-like isoform X2 [Limulus polyphemus]|uniref:DAZ-associated protein 2 n=1 Tax=Limulus polyphemus TaxID=6850 RepID=A0ABM1BGG3_LIMPO|nr:DAZ-associated protein 2-like isoform X2 [Limulus polyphemus]
MSSEKKEYPGYGASNPTAPAYPQVAHHPSMSLPYPSYPGTAFTAANYLPSTPPTYIPAGSYATPVGPPIPYGARPIPHPYPHSNQRPVMNGRPLAQPYPQPTQRTVLSGVNPGGMSLYGYTANTLPAQYLQTVPSMYATRPGATVYLPAGYDPGARFDGHGMPVVPPAPPGVTPNAAQLAMMQGNSVMLGQQKSSYMTGGSSGGYTFW